MCVSDCKYLDKLSTSKKKNSEIYISEKHQWRLFNGCPSPNRKDKDLGLY